MGETFKSVVPAHALVIASPAGNTPYSFQDWAGFIANNDPAFNKSVPGIVMAGRILNAVAGKVPGDAFEWLMADAQAFAAAVCRAMRRQNGFVQLVSSDPEKPAPELPIMRFAGYMACAIPEGFVDPTEPQDEPPPAAPAAQAA